DGIRDLIVTGVQTCALPISRYGYYSPVPSTAKKFLTPAEWDFWYDGKPAPSVINDPYGVPMEQPGVVRDGGSFVERVTNISCWKIGRASCRERVYSGGVGGG